MPTEVGTHASEAPFDRFELHAKVGEGGMGAVYRATCRRTSQPVAVKVLLPAGGDEHRFLREASLLREVQHDAVVGYVAHGRTNAGELFLAMEWLEGEDLEHVLSRGPLDVSRTVLLGARIASALAHVHARRLVHRDLKPSNLFLPDGDIARVKLLDFGIARSVDDRASLTRTGAIIGTPMYMAPEQARAAKEIGPGVDVFALGCVLFEMLTGKSPFFADTLIAALARILLDHPPRLSTVVPHVPEALADLVGCMLEKDPTLRPSAEEVEGRLATLLELPASLGAARTMAAPLNALKRAEAPVAGDDLVIGDAEQRVRVVLFAGPGGATDRTLRAEEVTPLQTAMQSIVRGHGGHLEFLANGAMVALFDREAPPTDLANDAAECAKRWGELHRPLAAAIATGKSTRGQTFAVGPAIERAAKFVLSTRAGEHVTLLDETTRVLLEGRYRIESKEGRVELHERLLHVGERPLLGKITQLVGREREVSTMKRSLREVLEDRLPRSLVLTAPPGLGKSRLLATFLAFAQAEPTPPAILFVRCRATERDVPLGVARALLEAALKLDERSSPDERRRALDDAFGADLASRGDFLGHLVGASERASPHGSFLAARTDPNMLAKGVQAAWSEWIESRIRREPQVLVIEDLHWGDELSIALLQAFLCRDEATPLLVVATARPEAHERFRSFFGEGGTVELRLAPISARASESLVLQALPNATPEDLAFILDRAGGQPFYIEELVRFLGNGGGRTGLPEGILAMVQLRFHGLSPEARRLLRAASLVGETFDEDSLRCLVGADPISHALQELVRNELCHPAESARSYRFQHALVRDAAYATLPDDERMRAHVAFATWLSTSNRAEPEVVAEHFVKGQSGALASLWLVKAAESAHTKGDLIGAEARVEAARRYNPEGATLGLALFIEAQLAFSRADMKRAATASLEATTLLAPNSNEWYRAMGRAITAAGQQGENARVADLSRRILEQPVEPSRRDDTIVLLARAASQLLWGHHPDGGMLAAKVEDLASEGVSILAKAWVARVGGDRAICEGAPIDRMYELFREAERAFREAGLVEETFSPRVLLAGGAFIAGDLEGSLSICEEVIREATARDAAFAAYFATFQAGLGCAFHGRTAEALARLRPLLSVLGTSGRIASHARQGIAVACWREGNNAEAIEQTTIAIEQMTNDVSRGGIVAVRALALADLGQRDEAVRVAKEARALTRNGPGFDIGSGLDELAHVRSLRLADRKDEARAALTDALSEAARRASSFGRNDPKKFWSVLVPNRLLLEEASHLEVELPQEIRDTLAANPASPNA